MARKTLLELTTDAPTRALIKIDDKTYELRSADDMGLKEQTELQKMNALVTDADTQKDWAAMSRVLDEMVHIVVFGIPDEVLAKLSDSKKLKIVEAFMQEVRGSRALPSPSAEAGVAQA